MSGARRRSPLAWLAGALVALMLVAGALTASHGHLGSGEHAATCAICQVARARSTTPSRPAPLPQPRCISLLPIALPALRPPPARPPLVSAPKHGPPARV
ncbi:MAG TPA: hypothetical protein VII38_08510 [Polyangia bacterium]